jgi:hypothetical protein
MKNTVLFSENLSLDKISTEILQQNSIENIQKALTMFLENKKVRKLFSFSFGPKQQAFI